MSNNDFGLITVQLFLLIALAHCADTYSRVCGSRGVVGEILAGLLLGPRFWSTSRLPLANLDFPPQPPADAPKHDVVLAFLYNLGLLLLMFVSGAENRGPVHGA